MSSCDTPPTEKDALMTPRPKFDKSRTCVKCKELQGNIVIRHAVYCKPCFTPLITTRFRKSLEPSVNPIPDGPRKKALKAAGNLMIGFSGGLGSTVLLDLAWKSYFAVKDGEGRGGKEHPRNQSAWKKGLVCHVEVSGAFPGMNDRTEDIRQVAKQYESKLDFIPLRIEDAFDEKWWNSIGGRSTHLGMDSTAEDLFLTSLSSPLTPTESLRKFISSLPTQTAVLAAINTLVRLLLLHTASAQQCSHLLLGTSLTTLSIALISGIAQGGGFSVREEAQEEWMRESEGEKGQMSVRVVRPLREVGIKECMIWAWWNGLKVVGRERYLGGRQGIGALTRDFIMGLERDYPSTVSTIARTCAKLAPKEDSERRCILCERPAQPGVQAWKSRISIRSYHETPSRPAHFTPSSSPPPPTQSALEALASHLCYQCHTMLTSRSSRGTAVGAEQGKEVPLPVWVGGGEVWTGRKVDREEMRSGIGEFLLDGGD
ncbi:hypothetical protein BDQ17DRAFT_1279401 [Cyathus striatus]|nr:hypothetical protein BDQ17DRAFT_1279401 [Cyathus striatus]